MPVTNPEYVHISGMDVAVYRWGTTGGYYAEARDIDGKRLAFTSVYVGTGSRQRAIDAAIYLSQCGFTTEVGE